MTDHETNPAGTAARIAGKTIADWIEFARRDDCLDDMVPSDLRQVISALTRANAATAAAYEVAARRVEREGHSLGDEILATPDQTAALDKLIAEAESRVWDKAADIARQAVEITGHRMREAKEKKNKKEERDWQSMLFCAVDIRTAILAASKKGGRND